MTSSNDKKTIKIAIVAGEKSGDELGAPLMHFLKANHPNIEFIGVGGSRMISEGLNSFFEMSEISVMGIIEPLLNLRRLLKLRKSLKGFLQEKIQISSSGLIHLTLIYPLQSFSRIN